MDEMLREACKYAQGEEWITISKLQRYFRISYPAAWRMLEEMKALGTISKESIEGTHRYNVLAQKAIGA